MIGRKLTVWIFAVLFPVLISGQSHAEGPVKPKPKDKCPVCGMFVSPYPQWTAEIIFRDGTYAVFDGPKDMLKYYFNISKYHKEKTGADISGIYVTEYYTTKMMSARDVYFVKDSDVMGPMGKELVPVRGEREAKTFLRDHQGKKMLKFGEITLKDIPR